MTSQAVLRDVFGYASFRDKQEEIISTVLRGNDSLVIMPTGGGKSLCYQIPALVLDGLAVVVSPLIALMDDQVGALRELNIRAATLHSNLGPSDASEIIASVRSGALDILYISPERILTREILHLLEDASVCLFAIDEAHCVSVWGNDFRPEYVKLSLLKKYFPGTPTIALTATADTATQADIAKQLGLQHPEIFVSSFERSNISVEAREGRKRLMQIVDFINTQDQGAGIVYCLSRKSTESVAMKLRREGHMAEAYHAGLDAAVRKSVQQKFQNDELNIVCATIAFGMGIDKPNIRWVIHYNMPKNIESYYQEIGRAGRDGEQSQALLFYSWGDYIKLKRFIDESEASSRFKEVQSAKLERMWQYATAFSCRTNLVLSYFGEYRSSSCGYCDNCRNPHEYFDGTELAQMALSAIVRVRQSIGLNLLVEVLRGSNTAEIRDRNLQKVKTYGVGRNIPARAWRDYITQLINLGILAIDFTNESNLVLTPLSRDVLVGNSAVQLARFEPVENITPVPPPRGDTSSDEYDSVLFEELRSWRLKKARSANLPAYVILHDRTIKELARLKPGSKSQLLAVNGIGQAKCDNYGEELLDLIARAASVDISTD